VPLALAEGAGAESRQQIGWVIVGGMALGTLLTLFVLPALYAALPERRRRVAQATPTPAPGEGAAATAP
jgi:multidrug efflux pump